MLESCRWPAAALIRLVMRRAALTSTWGPHALSKTLVPPLPLAPPSRTQLNHRINDKALSSSNCFGPSQCYDFAISLLTILCHLVFLRILHQARFLSARRSPHGKTTTGEPNNRLQFAGSTPSLPEQDFATALAAQQCTGRDIAEENRPPCEAVVRKQRRPVCACAYPQSKAQLAPRRKCIGGKGELWTPIHGGQYREQWPDISSVSLLYHACHPLRDLLRHYNRSS